MTGGCVLLFVAPALSVTRGMDQTTGNVCLGGCHPGEVSPGRSHRDGGERAVACLGRWHHHANHTRSLGSMHLPALPQSQTLEVTHWFPDSNLRRKPESPFGGWCQGPALLHSQAASPSFSALRPWDRALCGFRAAFARVHPAGVPVFVQLALLLPDGSSLTLTPSWSPPHLSLLGDVPAAPPDRCSTSKHSITELSLGGCCSGTFLSHWVRACPGDHWPLGSPCRGLNLGSSLDHLGWTYPLWASVFSAAKWDGKACLKKLVHY